MKLFSTYVLIFVTACLNAQATDDEFMLNRVDLTSHVRFPAPLTDTLAIEPNRQKPLEFIFPSDNVNFNSLSLKQSLASNYLNIYSDGEFRASLNVFSGIYLQESDVRGKKDVRKLKSGALQKLLQLEPITFLMKNHENKNRSVGLIAQDVREVFPALVQYVEGEEALALSYIELIPILVKAIQEQNAVIQNLKENQFVMQKELAAFRLQMAQLAENLSVGETTFRNGTVTIAQN